MEYTFEFKIAENENEGFTTFWLAPTVSPLPTQFNVRDFKLVKIS